MVDLIQMQTKQTLLTALTQAPAWSHGQKLSAPLVKIARSAVGKVGITMRVPPLLTLVAHGCRLHPTPFFPQFYFPVSVLRSWDLPTLAVLQALDCP